jgi:hypothetical protein
MNKIINIIKLFLIALLFITQSCSKDFLDQAPSNQQSPETIKTVGDAQLVINGTYALMQSNSYYNMAMIGVNDVRSDDMQTAEYGRLYNEYSYSYTPDVDMRTGIWAVPYTVIRQVNNILNFIDDIETVGDDELAKKNEIKGQALAVRALAHFDLCKLFGAPYSHDNGASLGIPIVTEVLAPGEEPTRNTVAEVYAQVISDLQTAIPLLSTSKTFDKINAWGAKTLLARVYLYMEDNSNAFSTAVDIINNSPYKLLSRDKYVDSWSKEHSDESIFSVINNQSDNGGGECIANLADPEGYGQFIATQDLIDLIASDPDDIRRELLYVDQTSNIADMTTWGRVLKLPGFGNTKALIVDHELNGAPLKVSAYVSNVPVFRLSEVYLIAAEAAVKRSDPANAALYLNGIVERANPNATVAEADATLDRILTERRKELMGEGHRFFDLVRNKKDIVRSNSGRVFDVAIPLTIPYNNYKIVFPIPRAELDANQNIEQNPGY